jgi:hypothetical protein
MILQNLLDLGDDEIDWVDLKNASEQLAQAIARDGVAIYENPIGQLEAFRKSALKSPVEINTGEVNVQIR